MNNHVSELYIGIIGVDASDANKTSCDLASLEVEVEAL